MHGTDKYLYHKVKETMGIVTLYLGLFSIPCLFSFFSLSVFLRFQFFALFLSHPDGTSADERGTCVYKVLGSDYNQRHKS